MYKRQYLYGDISKFNLGWNGYGLNWLSISGGRVKAPAKEAESNLVLEKMSGVVQSNKTTIKTDGLNVNAKGTE